MSERLYEEVFKYAMNDLHNQYIAEGKEAEFDFNFNLNYVEDSQNVITVSVASNISLTLTPKTSTAGKIYGITIGNDFSSPFNGVLCGIGNDSSSNGYLYIYNLSTGSKLKEVSLGTNIVGSQGTLTVSYTAAGAITASYGGKSLTTTIASVVDKYGTWSLE